MPRNQKELEKQNEMFRKEHPDQNLNSELHYEIAERFVKEYSLNEYDVALLTNKKQNVF